MLMLSPFYDRMQCQNCEKAAAVLNDHAENHLDNAANADCCLIQSKAINHCELNKMHVV